jgi:hypothetical protein
MSIAGYLARPMTELRMPKKTEKTDPLGISFEGPVLTGERSVQHRQRDEAIRTFDTTGEAYKRTEDYDSVLRAHLEHPE